MEGGETMEEIGYRAGDLHEIRCGSGDLISC